jgi:type VI protein secretion system component VasF
VGERPAGSPSPGAAVRRRQDAARKWIAAAAALLEEMHDLGMIKPPPPQARLQPSI